VYLSRELNYGELETAEKCTTNLWKTARNESFKQAVTDTRDAINRLNPGNPAPDFTMTDIMGRKFLSAISGARWFTWISGPAGAAPVCVKCPTSGS
jgi:hypothetical protein